MQSGSVLDLGAGWGRHTRYFLEHDFAVTAVDSDPEAIAALHRHQQQAPRLTVVSADIRTLPAAVTSHTYDVVLCRMALHFLDNQREVERVVRQMQRLTRVGGINVVAMFTTRNPKGLRPYLAQPEELQAYYDGWRVLEQYEGLSRWFRPSPDHTPTRNYVTNLTVQRVR